MFPRNIRNIVPWKLHQALIVLMKCSDLNVKSGDDQKYIYRMLEEAGIKGKSNTRDKNPGGMRTYLAQLSMLGMLYEDRDKQYRYTIAGQNLADGNNPLRVLQFQLLRHQYPSAYGLGRNVMIDPRMKVKPFMFLIRLMRDERIGGYLSCEDMMIPVVYGHNDSCYEICVQKILTARQGSIESAIDDFELDLYTPRSGMGSSLSNVKDTPHHLSSLCGPIYNVVDLLDQVVPVTSQIVNSSITDLGSGFVVGGTVKCQTEINRRCVVGGSRLLDDLHVVSIRKHVSAVLSGN